MLNSKWPATRKLTRNDNQKTSRKRLRRTPNYSFDAFLQPPRLHRARLAAWAAYLDAKKKPRQGELPGLLRLATDAWGGDIANPYLWYRGVNRQATIENGRM